MNYVIKTLPFTGRIKDIVPRQLADRNHSKPCSNTGLFDFKKSPRHSSGANRKIPILILRPEQAYCISYPGLLQGPGILIPKISNNCFQ